MKNSIVTQDDLKMALAKVFPHEDVELIMASPVRPDLHRSWLVDYKDYLFIGGQSVIREEIALAKAFANSGIFSLAVAFPH